MKSVIVRFFSVLRDNLKKSLAIGALVLVAALLLRSSPWLDSLYYKTLDKDPDRGAATVASDIFGDRFTRIAYLDQNWSASDSLWFYNITQGSNLLPYDFFIALEQARSQDLFRTPENMNRYRYLPQKKTRSNPDALPVGMVADDYRGKKYMGFTCAACHSSQVNYNGVGIRIDGGAGAADMDGFMNALSQSLDATRADPAKRKRFVDLVLKAGNYGDAAAVEKDLEIYALRLQAYNFFNDSPTPYGYARLDAFGRIYNRVLEHVINPEALKQVLSPALPPAELKDLLARLQPVLSAENRDHVMEQLVKLMTVEQRRAVRDKIFSRPTASVSYPFLWDIPVHDFVQWNGIGVNAGVGPIGRNAGEVIGVFATLDWAEKDGWTISSVLGGQGFGPRHTSFESSVNVHNLRQIERRLGSLWSPNWQDATDKGLLPALDTQRVERGARLFDRLCASCHANIERSSPQRRVVANMTKVSEIRTDPTMAKNSVEHEGFSGFMRNQYLTTGVGGILLNTRAPAAALLTKATQNVVATPDPDKWFFTRAADWAADLISAFFSNEIKPSVKAGNYTPDSTAAPFESLRAYKGRSLNGIWATAPYLHNGSVPTLYDLLLPAEARAGDAAGTLYRPKTFVVGSRELDVSKVGFRHEGYDCFVFDTSLPNNSNGGHEYGTRALSDEDRWDLVEYLKSL